MQSLVFISERLIQHLQFVIVPSEERYLGLKARNLGRVLCQTVEEKNSNNVHDFTATNLISFVTRSFSFSWSFAFRSMICCEFSPFLLCNSVSSSCWVNSFCSRPWILSWRRLSPPPTRSPCDRRFSFCIDSCKFSYFKAFALSKILLSGSEMSKQTLRLCAATYVVLSGLGSNSFEICSFLVAWSECLPAN
jgi:hypothetical protein